MKAREPVLRVQINQIDYTLEEPGTLDFVKIQHVPVIRIYGSSSTGKKACVNIHEVYPYFYIDYLGVLDPRGVNEYIARLFSSLNYAIALSLKRSNQSYKNQYIRAIVLVKGVPFYGFHASYSPFLKILISDPTLVSRIVRILRSGVVMRTHFKIYESHLSFALQFMCDFNLYGCGWIDLGEIWQREDEVLEISQDSQDSDFQTSTYLRQSRMELEIDVSPHQILNRLNLTARDMHHEVKVSESTADSAPLVHSVRELWEDERRRRRLRGIDSDPVMQSTPRERIGGSGGKWISEARWWQGLIEKIQAEKDKEQPSGLPVKWDKGVMTVFESVEALWDEKWRRWKPPASGKNRAYSSGSYEYMCEDVKRTAGGENIDVDEDSVALVVSDVEEAADEEVENERPFTGDELNEDPEGQDDDGEQAAKDKPEHETEKLTSEVEHTAGLNALASSSIGSYSMDSKGSPVSSSHAKKRTNPFMEAWNKAVRRKADLLLKEDQSDQPCDMLNSQSSSSRRKTNSYEGASNPDTRKALTQLSISNDSEVSGVALTQIKSANLYLYSRPPPSATSLRDTLPVIYQAPFYSDKADAPAKPIEFAGLAYPVQTADSMERWPSIFDKSSSSDLFNSSDDDRWKGKVSTWEYAGGRPPSLKMAKEWLENVKGKSMVRSRPATTQLVGPTPANPYGYRISPISRSQMNSQQNYSMSVLSLEILANTHGNRSSNPEYNAIMAVCCFLDDDSLSLPSDVSSTPQKLMIIIQDPSTEALRLHDPSFILVAEELELINLVIERVNEWDPDILAGWEVQNSSWGYLSARGEQHGLNIPELISRAPPTGTDLVISSSQWDIRNSSTLHVAGRHVLNVWRVMRSTQTLNAYTFENVAFHLLQHRVPRYLSATLTKWFRSGLPAQMSRALSYLSTRASLVLEMLAQANIIGQTAEFARVFGVDFFSVLTRGSQFKVESFMFRIAKPESFVLISPSKLDVGKQNAAECMPLIMEPLSSLYTSPLVVLDFQSLYPSIMIAYNYCFSTCLGRVTDFKGKNKLGVTDYELPPGFLGAYGEHVSVAPNGIVYVKPEVRRGLLGRMLTELLDTRIMIKEALKASKDNKVLQKILDARQLSLKYIANVTYGYTSASFSGRMPAVEIADSIVQSGRETLEKAIRTIRATPRWGAEVVYGDTDSLFIYLPGKSKHQAFRIGHDIADTITTMNPRPIKLKFEKVYLPCVLMAKKRYVGFKYEDPDAVEPVFDAKGIETVRRDGIAAQSKMVETCLKILFRTKDLSEVKHYCRNFWSRMLEDKVSPHDFIFAKEVRLGTYSEKGPPIPGVSVALRRKNLDPYDEPQYGERVPYVILRGEPNSRLYERAFQPEELLNDSRKRLDATYYITKVLIPPLDRIFRLVGADVKSWYDEMPKIVRVEKRKMLGAESKQSFFIQSNTNQFTIDEHFHSNRCAVCNRNNTSRICPACRNNPDVSIATLLTQLRKAETSLFETHQVCSSCSGAIPGETIQCWSLDCPWLYERKKAENRLTLWSDVPTLVDELS